MSECPTRRSGGERCCRARQRDRRDVLAAGATKHQRQFERAREIVETVAEDGKVLRIEIGHLRSLQRREIGSGSIDAQVLAVWFGFTEHLLETAAMEHPVFAVQRHIPPHAGHEQDQDQPDREQARAENRDANGP